jgi:transposase
MSHVDGIAPRIIIFKKNRQTVSINRKARDCFMCVKCKYTNHADVVAAINILGQDLSG